MIESYNDICFQYFKSNCYYNGLLGLLNAFEPTFRLKILTFKSSIYRGDNVTCMKKILFCIFFTKVQDFSNLIFI